MTRTPVVVGVDLGTSNAKALAYDARLRLWGRAKREYPISSPAPGRAEQDPDAVVDAALACLDDARGVAEAAGAEVVGVSLSAAMHSLLGIDAAGRPATPALTYADGRATAEAAALRDGPDGPGLHLRTGTPVHPMSPLTKLAWFAAHEPDLFASVTRWRSLKEHLLARLGAPDVVDAAIASATGLYDLGARDWDDDALAIAGITRDHLAPVVGTDTVVEAGGLDVPLVVGGNDGALANLGSGVLGEGRGALTVGTSGALRATTVAPITDRRLFTTVLDDDRYVVGGAINNGGLVLRWLREQWFRDREGPLDYEALTALAADVPAGAEGLLWLPYLTGERAPDWLAGVRGGLLGMDLRHGRGHLVRAAMEGVGYQLRRVAEAVVAAGPALDELRVTGGFTRSPLWLQVVADVLGRPLAVPADPEGSTLGAAMLGLVALGHLPSLDDAAAMVTVARTVEPDVVAHEQVHAAGYERFVAASRLLAAS